MNNKIIDVYLEDDHFNPVCNAAIPGAWVAVIEVDYLGEIKQPFARPHEFSSVIEARKAAEKLYN